MARTIIEYRKRDKRLLEALGLGTLAEVRQYVGEQVKQQRGRRDILRLSTLDESGQPVVMYLKRIHRPYLKDGLWSLLRSGQVRSMARQEWENLQALRRAGVPTAEPVGFGEECGLLRERFSFIITRAAPAGQTIEDLLAGSRDMKQRRRVIEALARLVGRMHEAGPASPDLFPRHFFVDPDADPVGFWLIDMARLDRRRGPVSQRLRARDLTVLHLGMPRRRVSMTERLRFLRAYAGDVPRHLVRRIERRARALLKRRKFRESFES